MISHRFLGHALFGALVASSALSSTEAQAQALPSPKELATSLDLECYRTPGPSLDINIQLTHLNPVLLAMGAQPHNVWIRELAQTCVPVRKNNTWPHPDAKPFVEQIDFGCFRLDAQPVQVPLNLTHINPVLANLPQHFVTLERPAQLCVPMAKNGVLPPPAVLQLVQYLDLECYQVDGAHPQFGVTLHQLNPQLQNIPPHFMTLVPQPRQLCVPVRKGNQQIPQWVRDRIQWIDLEKFAAQPEVQVPQTNVVLSHLNPAFAGLPPIPVWLQWANSLMVPVAKNGQIPPND